MQPMYSFNGELWLYDGDAAWYFITLPTGISKEIKMVAPARRGFGSLRVAAKIGSASWKTSIFPDSKSGSYLLPVKKEIRAKNNLAAGDSAKVVISLIDL